MATKPPPLDKANPSLAETGPQPKQAEKPTAKTSATASTAPATKPVPREKPSGAAEKPVSGRAVGVREELEERDQLGSFHVWIREALRQTPSWLVSMVFHMIVLLVLALWMLPAESDDDRGQLVVDPRENEQLDDLEELEDEPLQEIDLTTDVVAVETQVQPEEVPLSPADDMQAAAIHVDLSEFGLEHAPRNDLLATVGAYYGNALSGRGSARGALAAKYGGTTGSEKAVALALQWLAAHQLPDGGWSFDHRPAPSCGGKCRNAGNATKARIGATGMALLPFLGAGQTHKEGKYKQTVKGGLYFLRNRMKLKPQGGDLWEQEGRMYSHGLASIALCEAYAMTHDKSLGGPAQAALNFICYAQDPVGGGWRYEPRQKGDTSVVGWQIMALKSGHMAYLRVPPTTVKKAYSYLDGVQANSGANYGYTGPGEGPATTAIGLLCRMYLGWKKDNPALQRGVKWLNNKGPSPGNMYYNYYATQVMRHWEGQEWKKWNGKMRDQLVNSQVQNKDSHELGSWHMKGGDHGSDRGGRLYCTAMATMVLEVYYRHLPIYRGQAVEEDFPE